MQFRLLSEYLRKNYPVYVLALWLISAMPLLAANPQCLVLNQTSKSFGEFELFASPTAVKLVNKSKRITTLARLSDGKVFTYNPDLKLYYETTLKEWKPQFAQRMAFMVGELANLKDYKPAGTEIIAGLKTKKFIADDTHSETDLMLKGSSKKARLHRINVKNKQCWILEGENIPRSLSDFVAKIYGLPPLGLPIRFTAIMENNRVGYFCETQGFKRVPLTSVDFSMPKGYKLTHSDGELYLDDTSSQLLKFLN